MVDKLATADMEPRPERERTVANAMGLFLQEGQGFAYTAKARAGPAGAVMELIAPDDGLYRGRSFRVVVQELLDEAPQRPSINAVLETHARAAMDAIAEVGQQGRVLLVALDVGAAGEINAKVIRSGGGSLEALALTYGALERLTASTADQLGGVSDEPTAGGEG